MGWCHAFGPQIRDGCDHAMVAGHDSCSCGQCGAVCYGMFPGCASVWAAGPRPVTITRPAKEFATHVPVIEPVAPAARPAAPDPADVSELHALRVDLQMLLWKFDQLQQAAPAGEQLAQAAKDIGAVARALPQQVQEAVAAALATQRKATLHMFAQIEQEIRADIEQMREKLQRELRRPSSPAAAPAAPAVSVGDLDTRFQWLVDAMSERFITLGNGLARIERQMAPGAADTNGALTNGAAAHGGNGAGGNGSGLASGARWGTGTVAPSADAAGAAGDKARP